VRGFVLFHRTPPTPGNKGGTTMQCVVAHIAPLGQDPVLTEWVLVRSARLHALRTPYQPLT